MINLMKADMKSIKLFAFVTLIPAVFVIAFISTIFSTSIFYVGISLITLGLSFETFNKQTKDKIPTLIISLPVTRKEYITVKYVIVIPWFIIASITMTILILLFDRDFSFFSLKIWLITFALTIMFASLFFLINHFWKTATFPLFIFCITFTLSLNLPDKMSEFFSLINHWLIYLVSLLITVISYCTVLSRFKKTDIT
ncbi:ABC-2 transporter permease [Bacillus sp. FSL K6-3431]|uniref:ABC-2 transporter permease n=1 Tax=Bacillus sp. FSL K6-3431 TaxID=2921500 RepID=UPI0030F6A3EC